MGRPLVLIVEDHPMMVDALTANLSQCLPFASFLHAGSLAHGLKALALQPHIDVLLLDLNLPDAQGMQTLETFCNARPQGALLVFSGVESTDVIEMCLANNVAFLSKSESSTSLCDKVRQLLQSVDSDFSTSVHSTQCVANEPDPQRMQWLSERQWHVLSQLAKGKSSREVALALGIEESTVRTHQNAIYQRLGVKNKTQASAVYWQWAHRLGRSDAHVTVGDEVH